MPETSHAGSVARLSHGECTVPLPASIPYLCDFPTPDLPDLDNTHTDTHETPCSRYTTHIDTVLQDFCIVFKSKPAKFDIKFSKKILS